MNVTVCNPVSTTDMLRKKKHKKRIEKQKRTKQVAIKVDLLLNQNIGSIKWAKVKVNLAPYNGAGATQWLIPSGATVLAEKFPRGYVLWLTRGITWSSVADMKANCIKYNFAHKHELEFIAKVVTIK